MRPRPIRHLPSLATVADRPLGPCTADTLGYNLSLFSHRVHDVLTCVSAVSPIAGEAGLHLFGLGGSAGAIVAAAGALAGSGTITSLAIDAAGALATPLPKFFQLELSLA